MTGINRVTTGTRQSLGSASVNPVSIADLPEYSQIELLYRLMLQRVPDTSGFDSSLQYLRGGGEVVELATGIRGSIEFASLCPV